jgi:TPR repeat protein
MYAEGQGVLQDNIYAHMWFNIAASNGNANGAKNRGIAAKNMTAPDLSKAQDFARECVAKNYKGC